jgi:hypothetical protein
MSSYKEEKDIEEELQKKSVEIKDLGSEIEIQYNYLPNLQL